MPMTTTITDKKKIADESGLLKMWDKEFTKDELSVSYKLEIEQSLCNDSGMDYNIFRLFDKGGQLIAKRYIGGY